MIPLTLMMLLTGIPAADVPATSMEEAIYWEDYAPCGLVSLYLICRLQEKTVRWEEVKQLVGPPGRDGELNFANLSTAASKLGMNPVGLEVGRQALNELPMPAIIQVHDSRYPDEVPHFLVLLRPAADGVWLLDAPYAAYFLPEEHFQQSWTGNILIFARDEQEAAQIEGRAYDAKGLQCVAWGLIVGGIVLLPMLVLIGWLKRPRIRNPFSETLIDTYSPQLIGIIKRKALPIALLLLFLIVCGVLSVHFLIHSRDVDAPPRCEFDKQVMELGELTPGEHDIKVPIKNSGNHPLHIANAASNCTCCEVVRSPSVIQPRQGATLDVQVTATHRPRSIRLTVDSNDPAGAKHIVLTWQGKSRPALLPRWVTATNVPVDRPYERIIRFIYPGGKSALVPHLKSYKCDQEGIEVREGRNDPLANKFTSSGVLTNILGEMELHLRINPVHKLEYLQTICGLTLSYGSDALTIKLPINLSFTGGQLTPDVNSVTFSAVEREELLSQERVVVIADREPHAELEVTNVPQWLSCEFKRKTQKGYLLLIKIRSIPSALPLQYALQVGRKGASSPQANLRVNVMSGSRF